MSRIQITLEITHSLRNLRGASRARGDSDFGRFQRFHFNVGNQLTSFERYASIITRMGELGSRYHTLLQQDVERAEGVIEAARQRDREQAGVWGVSS